MRKYSLMETRLGKTGFGLFLFVMLLLARDSMITTALLGFTRSQFLMLGILCVFGLWFLFLNRKAWKQLLRDKRLLALGISAAVLLIPMVCKQDWQMMYFSILICLFFAVFLTFFTNVSETAKYYVGILTALSLYSLIATYVLRPLVWRGILSVPTFVNASGWDFYNFGLCNAVTWEGWNRNFGIYREPGVYQYFILLALYLNNYAVSWKKQGELWLVNLILAVTMVSTFSVGGYMEIALLAVFIYLDKKWYREKWGKILLAAVLAAAVGLTAHFAMVFKGESFGDSIYYEFYDMIIRLTTDSDSLVDRMDAVFTDLEFFFQSPLLGDRIALVLHGTEHNTSSTLILFAILGVAGGMLNVLAWAALIWKKDRHVIGNLVLLGILFLSFNTQNLVADMFFWLFPTMALVERGMPKLQWSKRKG